MKIKSYRLPLFIIFFFLVVAGFAYLKEAEKNSNKGLHVELETAPLFLAKNDSMQATIISSSLINECPKDVYAGKIFLRKGIKISEHSHPCTEILVAESGEGKLSVADTVYHLHAGSAVIIPSGVLHSFVAEEDFLSIQIYGESGQEQKYFGWKRGR